MNTKCIICGTPRPTDETDPLYWVQVSKTQMVDGVWRNLYVEGIDLYLCGIECSAAQVKQTNQYGDRDETSG